MSPLPREPWQWPDLRHTLQRWGIPSLDLHNLEAGAVMPESTCFWIADELRQFFEEHRALFKREHVLDDDELWLGNGMLQAVVESLKLWEQSSGGVQSDA